MSRATRPASTSGSLAVRAAPQALRPGGKWHLVEVLIKSNGDLKYLWRAVDQNGNVLDILAQNRRDKAAPRHFFRRKSKKTGIPRVAVTTSSAPTAPSHARWCPPSSIAAKRD
ncbi:DDE-type integrase/transposase/recombinase [Streptomyces sp. NPDC008061]|uniref:DDE-type integrase/transposase/recombinase n=1 Tax=Streptomyces sp. NPDC008061 TaxID=3364805 RepID=UPI0036E7868F